MLTLSLSQVEQVTVVKLAGALDSAAAQTAARQLSALCAQEQPRIALDLSKLSRVTSAGLRVLFDAFLMVRDKGQLVLFAPNPVVGDALAFVGLPLLVSICRDQDAAFAAFGQPVGVS